MLGIYCRTSRETDIESSTISQQKIAGIKFAEEYNFEYELYEDEGKSGFKISDDDLDPFNNRPAFMNLINDIKTKKIDKVWVWEHSRLSRNNYASAFIFNVFEKFNITLYENKKEMDLNDPQLKFTRQVLDAVSEYERQLIVARTSRGQKKQFEEGRRVHQKLFCYEKAGKNDKGYTIWKPVESEIETYKYILKRYKDGASLRKIMFEVYDMNNIEKYQFASYAAKMGTILRKYQYTGYQLSLEGIDIYKRFRKNEINNLQILKDKKYWIKSVPYPLELISIDDWITVAESLQIRGSKMNLTRKGRILRASKDIGTGLISCGDCGIRFYYKEQKVERKNTGWKKYYYTYFHSQGFKTTICKQYPRSFSVENINEIFKLFYFYFFMVFDNTNELMKESQQNIKHQQIKIKEEIEKLENNITKTKKQLSKFQMALESSDDIEVIKTLAKNISQSNNKIEEQKNSLSKLKISLESLNEKFSKNLLEITYYEVTDKINNWFYNMNIEEQRNELIKVLRACKVFNKIILIDAGTVLFFFDGTFPYKFNYDMLNNLDKDSIYKKYFIADGKQFPEINEKLWNIDENEILNRDEYTIFDIKLKDISEKNINTNKKTAETLFEVFNIKYDISNHSNIIVFLEGYL
jgi:DNA invertase Pin-like site-specific DNA recombinase